MWTRPEVGPTLFLQLGEQAAGLGWERLTPGADWWTKTVHERKAEHGRTHARPGEAGPGGRATSTPLFRRVRAAFGDGVENSQPISLFALLSKRPHLTTSLVFKTPPLYVHALIFLFFAFAYVWREELGW